jgi:hypothetical protein
MMNIEEDFMKETILFELNLNIFKGKF